MLAAKICLRSPPGPMPTVSFDAKTDPVIVSSCRYHCSHGGRCQIRLPPLEPSAKPRRHFPIFLPPIITALCRLLLLEKTKNVTKVPAEHCFAALSLEKEAKAAGYSLACTGAHCCHDATATLIEGAASMADPIPGAPAAESTVSPVAREESKIVMTAMNRPTARKINKKKRIKTPTQLLAPAPPRGRLHQLPMRPSRLLTSTVLISLPPDPAPPRDHVTGLSPSRRGQHVISAAALYTSAKPGSFEIRLVAGETPSKHLKPAPSLVRRPRSAHCQ